MARRRALLARVKSAPIIGYKLGYNLNGSGLAEQTDPYFFVTGFIPYTPSNGEIKLTAKYSSTGYGNPAIHFMVFYNDQQTIVDTWTYYDMTVQNQRTVTNTNQSLVNSTAYIRFVGREDSINDCFVRDDATGIILWQKGM